MTIEEASETYCIPMEILKTYECLGLRDEAGTREGQWQYDDQDAELLSMIMTLYDVGFDTMEIETYMRLILKGTSTAKQRLDMLNLKRHRTLEHIHLLENQLSRLDYLRHDIKKCSQFK